MQESKSITNEAPSSNDKRSNGQKTLSAFADKLLKECKIKVIS